MKKSKLKYRRLGIVGCGAIGSLVARLLEKEKVLLSRDRTF